MTGADSFIGKNVSIFLSKKNEIKEITNAELVITSSYDLLRELKEFAPSVVINCAEYGNNNPRETHEAKINEINYRWTIKLLDASRTLDIPLFIQTSQMPVNPDSTFAYCKKLSNQYCETLQRNNESDTKIIIFKLLSAYGYYDNQQNLIPKIILNSLKKKTIDLDNPEYQNDFIFIDDICKAYDKASKLRINNTFYLGTGFTSKIKEIIELYKRIDPIISVRWGKKITDYPFTEPDIIKTIKELNWKPKTTLEEGLRKTTDWFANNIDSYQIY
ncbi:MAG: NAD-dependent epimerase/dehydratase family protein [Gammaproteobacteria bacterium]